MSDPSLEYECSQCGRNGYPPVECEKCHGKAPIAERQFTLSEIRTKKAPADPRRGDDGAVGPRIVKMPGS